MDRGFGGPLEGGLRPHGRQTDRYTMQREFGYRFYLVCYGGRREGEKVGERRRLKKKKREKGREREKGKGEYSREAVYSTKITTQELY